MKMHVMARIDPSSPRCRRTFQRDRTPDGDGWCTTLPVMTLPADEIARYGSMWAVDVAVRVLAPGTPGTDTSARLVTQVTVTDTHPPATKLDVSTLICGAGRSSPAPARDPCAAATAWLSASEGSDWTTAAWTPARAADSTSPWAESTRPRAIMRTMTIKRTGATITSSAMADPSSPRARRVASATGPVLLDGGVARGRHGEVEPGDERLGPSGDGDLGRVTGECRGRDLGARERARTGGVR